MICNGPWLLQPVVRHQVLVVGSLPHNYGEQSPGQTLRAVTATGPTHTRAALESPIGSIIKCTINLSASPIRRWPLGRSEFWEREQTNERTREPPYTWFQSILHENLVLRCSPTCFGDYQYRRNAVKVISLVIYML